MNKILACATALTLALTAPAFAKGPGKYKIAGENADDKSTYTGEATITKTAEGVYRVVSVIDGDKFDAYAIGDDDVFAMTFTSSGKTGVGLYVAQDDGSYKSIWAFKGDRKISTEMLAPK